MGNSKLADVNYVLRAVGALRKAAGAFRSASVALQEADGPLRDAIAAFGSATNILQSRNAVGCHAELARGCASLEGEVGFLRRGARARTMGLGSATEPPIAR